MTDSGVDLGMIAVNETSWNVRLLWRPTIHGVICFNSSRWGCDSIKACWTSNQVITRQPCRLYVSETPPPPPSCSNCPSPSSFVCWWINIGKKCLDCLIWRWPLQIWSFAHTKGKGPKLHVECSLSLSRRRKRLASISFFLSVRVLWLL